MIELLAFLALVARLILARLFKLKSATAYVLRLYKVRRAPSPLYLVSLALASLLLAIPALVDHMPVSVKEVEIAASGPVELNLTIRREPVVIIVLDVSGSMSGEKLSTAKEQVMAFLDEVEDVKVGFIAFSDRVVAVVRPTYNYTKIKRVLGLLEAGGRTFYSCALASALSIGGNGTHVIMVTDGEPKDPARARELAAQLVREYGVTIHGVFIGNSSSGREYLRNLTKIGRGYFVEGSVEGLSSVLSELVASAVEEEAVERPVRVDVVKKLEIPPLDLAGLAILTLAVLFSLASFLSSRWI